MRTNLKCNTRTASLSEGPGVVVLAAVRARTVIRVELLWMLAAPRADGGCVGLGGSFVRPAADSHRLLTARTRKPSNIPGTRPPAQASLYLQLQLRSHESAYLCTPEPGIAVRSLAFSHLASRCAQKVSETSGLLEYTNSWWQKQRSARLSSSVLRVRLSLACGVAAQVSRERPSPSAVTESADPDASLSARPRDSLTLCVHESMTCDQNRMVELGKQ